LDRKGAASIYPAPKAPQLRRMAEAETGGPYMPMTSYPGAHEPEDMPPAPQGPDENRQAAAPFRRAMRLWSRTGQANAAGNVDDQSHEKGANQ
jgi:hypothetical protein